MRSNLRQYSSSFAVVAGAIFVAVGIFSWQISFASIMTCLGMVLILVAITRKHYNLLKVLKRILSNNKLFITNNSMATKSIERLRESDESTYKLIKLVDHRTRTLLSNDKLLADSIVKTMDELKNTHTLISQLDFRTRRIFEQTSSKSIEENLAVANLSISSILASMESELKTTGVMRAASKDLHYTLGLGFANLVRELELLSAHILELDNQIKSSSSRRDLLGEVE